MVLVEITYNPFQGLKHDQILSRYPREVEITYNPFQGLKLIAIN
ncbi:conserved hypothetical protein [Planktothrix sp. PCC 11201]|nr:conserved hypothetical protein [Planktothrix sp. PCC 11201]